MLKATDVGSIFPISQRNNDSGKGTDLSTNDFMSKQKKRKKRGVIAIGKTVD